MQRATEKYMYRFPVFRAKKPPKTLSSGTKKAYLTNHDRHRYAATHRKV